MRVLRKTSSNGTFAFKRPRLQGSGNTVAGRQFRSLTVLRKEEVESFVRIGGILTIKG